jgi:hypothetical protein
VPRYCIAVLLLALPAFCQSQGTLSPDFKKAAWKALDAVARIPMSKGEASEDKTETLITDADKEVDEAKYVATERDKKAMRVLGMLWVSRSEAARVDVLRADSLGHPVTNPLYRKYRDRGLQCLAEALVYITPNEASSKAKETAKLKTCTDDDSWPLSREVTYPLPK